LFVQFTVVIHVESTVLLHQIHAFIMQIRKEMKPIGGLGGRKSTKQNCHTVWHVGFSRPSLIKAQIDVGPKPYLGLYRLRNSARAPLHKTSVNGSAKVPG